MMKFVLVLRASFFFRSGRKIVTGSSRKLESSIRTCSSIVTICHGCFGRSDRDF